MMERRSFIKVAVALLASKSAHGQVATAECAVREFVRGLMRTPNPFQTGKAFIHEVEQQISFARVSMILVLRDKNNCPCQMYVVPAAYMQPVKPGGMMPDGGWMIDKSFYGFVGFGGLVVPSAYVLKVRSAPIDDAIADYVTPLLQERTSTFDRCAVRSSEI